jgi:hypothetical protein
MGRKMTAQGKAQRRPGLAVVNSLQALKGRDRTPGIIPPDVGCKGVLDVAQYTLENQPKVLHEKGSRHI